MSAIITIITLVINSFLPFTGILGILIKAIVSLIVIIVAFMIVYHNNPNAKIISDTVKIAFLDKRNKNPV